jgi:PTS system mannose-specific IID component
MPEEKALSRVGFADLLQVFLRTFLLQVLWNFERYLSYGMTYALMPVLRKIYPTREDRALAMTRHMEYFNTHPYMASFVLGAIIHMEKEKQEQPKSKQKQKEDEISALKVGMMGPIAAMGDNLFWATVRPYCGLIAVTLVLSNAFPSTQFWVAPLFFLVVYNIAHVGIRAMGFMQGYRQGDQVVLALRKFRFQGAIHGLRLACILLLGLLIVFVNLSIHEKETGLFALNLVFFTALVGLFTFFLNRKISPSQMFYAVVLLALMLSFWPILSSPPAIPLGGK